MYPAFMMSIRSSSASLLSEVNHYSPRIVTAESVAVEDSREGLQTGLTPYLNWKRKTQWHSDWCRKSIGKRFDKP